MIPCFENMVYDQCHTGIKYGLQYLWVIPTIFLPLYAVLFPIIWKISKRQDIGDVKHE